MRVRHGTSVVLLAGSAFLSGWTFLSCRQVVDHEARTYVRAELAPYLDAITAKLCLIKYQKAPAASGRVICPGPEVPSPKAPVDGDPGEASDDKDSAYIRYELEPYLDSLAYQLCQVMFRVDPELAAGGEICSGGPEGYKKPPANGAP
jgi:hypothetical protein